MRPLVQVSPTTPLRCLRRNVRLTIHCILSFCPQGEVGVSYFPRPIREIIEEDKLTLVDRMYQPGDLLKRSVDDVRSGIVTGCVTLFISL